MKLDVLHDDLFGGEPHPLSPQVRAWLAASRRFAAFVAAARSKIRKKLLGARTPESVAGLELELETAFLLLRERAFDLAYEPQVRGQPRGPDFAVSFTTHATVMLEVTRLAALEPAERLAELVCAKLGQCLPQHSNVLLIGVPAPAPDGEALRAAMLGLQQRAEASDAALLAGFRDRGAFFAHYRRLSEVLVCGLPRQAGEPPSAWVNPQARCPLSNRVRTALYRSMAAPAEAG